MKNIQWLIGAICTGICLLLMLSIGVLWYRGQLTWDRVGEIRDVLSLSAASAREKEAAGDVEVAQPSWEEILEARARLSAEYHARDTELILLKGLTQSWAEQLKSDRETLDKHQKAFESGLEKLDGELASESTEQARGVLAAMPAKAAVDALMKLSLEEDVILLKGLPDKSIAKILKEFKIEEQPAEPGSRAERGAKIFEALTKGDPQRSILDQELNALGTNAPTGPSAANTGTAAEPTVRQ